MEDQYSSMSVAALREVAKGRGLRTSGMKKQELIDALIQMEIEDQKEQQEDSNAALKHKPTGDSKQKELTEKITEAVKEKEKPEKSTGKRRISKTVEKSVIETTEDIEKEQIEPQNEIKTEPKLTIPIQEKEEGIQYHTIIYEAPYGERILINDKKNSGLKTALAINTKRDCFCEYNFKINEEL